ARRRLPHLHLLIDRSQLRRRAWRPPPLARPCCLDRPDHERGRGRGGARGYGGGGAERRRGAQRRIALGHWGRTWRGTARRGCRGLRDALDGELGRIGASASNLVFEITETAAIEEFDAARAFAERVVSLGARLALDDFGTGLGSLTHLHRLPVTFLKIDRSFV